MSKTFKCAKEHDLRRFTVALPITLQALYTKVEALYQCKKDSFFLTYPDEVGDEINLSCEQDLVELLNQTGLVIPRVRVHEKKGNSCPQISKTHQES
jgi:hypothetical protein